MKEVILSHDSEAKIYSVPDKVADHLEKYCLDFAVNWVWNGPERERFLKDFGDGTLVAVYGAPDFIDYLNIWVIPEQQSGLIKALGCYDYEIPDEYIAYPKFNF